MKREIYLNCLAEIINTLKREKNETVALLTGFEQNKSKTFEEQKWREINSRAWTLHFKQEIAMLCVESILNSKYQNYDEDWIESIVQVIESGFLMAKLSERNKHLSKDMNSFLSELKERLISCSTENANK